MFSIQNIDKNYFNPILNFQQNVQQSSAFLSLIVPDLFSVDSQGQKDRQVQRDRYKDKDVLYHRMVQTRARVAVLSTCGEIRRVVLKL